MNSQEFLLQLGLTKRQAQIYLDLSSRPNSTVVEISKRISIPRSSIYLELDVLIDQGFVSSKKIGKTRVFAITNPKNITFQIEAEKERFNTLSGVAPDIIDQLVNTSKPVSNQASTNIYEGQAGIKQQLWNILQCESGLVVGYSPDTLENVTDRTFAEKWRAEFKARGLKNRMILNVPKAKIWSDVSGFLDENVETKSLEKEQISFEHEVMLYDNTISIISPKHRQNQYGVEITDELLTKSYMTIFNFLWDNIATWPEKID